MDAVLPSSSSAGPCLGLSRFPCIVLPVQKLSPDWLCASQLYTPILLVVQKPGRVVTVSQGHPLLRVQCTWLGGLGMQGN